MSTVETESGPFRSHLLPERFVRWFAGRGWSPREHQLDLLQKARDDRSALLIAPTGAGKTLAGFLPTLVELPARHRSSPLPPRSGGEGSGVGGLPRVPLAANVPRHRVNDPADARSTRGGPAPLDPSPHA